MTTIYSNCFIRYSYYGVCHVFIMRMHVTSATVAVAATPNENISLAICVRLLTHSNVSSACANAVFFFNFDREHFKRRKWCHIIIIIIRRSVTCNTINNKEYILGEWKGKRLDSLFFPLFRFPIVWQRLCAKRKERSVFPFFSSTESNT